MKKLLTAVLVVLILGGALWAARAFSVRRMDQKFTKFNQDADSLIQGIHEEREGSRREAAAGGRTRGGGDAGGWLRRSSA